METNMMILAGLGIAATAAAGWWMKNRSTTISGLADAIEDKIEDVTGIDLELDDVVEDVVAEAEEVAEEVLEAVEDSLEAGDSLEDVADKAADAAAEAIDDVEIDLDALEDMTVAALKEKLKEVGLPISGKKADLIKRLVDKLTEVEA